MSNPSPPVSASVNPGTVPATAAYPVAPTWQVLQGGCDLGAGSRACSSAPTGGGFKANPEGRGLDAAPTDPTLLPSDGTLPPSCRGAPAELKSSIRKRQNVESAIRSRIRKQQETAVLHETVEEQTKTIEALRGRVQTLASEILLAQTAAGELPNEAQSQMQYHIGHPPE